MASRIYWSKYDNNGKITTPEIGAAGNIVGSITYTPVTHWTNGVDNQSAGNHVSVPGIMTALQGSRMTFGFMWTPHFSHGDGSFIDIFGLDNGSGDVCQMYYDPRFPRITLIAISGGKTTFYTYDTAWITAGNEYQIAIVFDDANAGNKMALYVGTYGNPKSLITPLAVNNNDGFNWESAIRYDTTIPGDTTNSIIDNLMIWDDALTDMTWMDYEDGLVPAPVPTPTGLTATQGTLTGKVTTVWNPVVGTSPEYMVSRGTVSGGPYTDLSGWISGTTWDDTSTVGSTHYFYVVRAKISGTEGSESSEAEGWALYVSPAVPVFDRPILNQSRILVTNNKIDIMAGGYVGGLVKVVEERTYQRKKIIVNQFQLQVKNFDENFSVDNPRSIFKGRSIFQPITVYNYNNDIIFDGIITDIERDHQTKIATLTITDKIDQFSRVKVDYTSSDWETPAQAVKNILDKYGFTDYDTRSIYASHSLYESNNFFIQCNFPVTSNTFLLQAIEKLGDLGCADAYIHKNKLCFRHFRPWWGIQVQSLNIGDILTAPKVNILWNEVVNDYSIRYSGDDGVPVKDDDAGNIGMASRNILQIRSLPEIAGTETSHVAIMDRASAVYLGESYIRRTHKNLSTRPQPLQSMKFDMTIRGRIFLDVNSYYRMYLTDEAWTGKLFEVMSTERDDANNIQTITAYEVDDGSGG